MNFKIVAVFCLLFALNLVKAEDYEDQLNKEYQTENDDQHETIDYENDEPEANDTEVKAEAQSDVTDVVLHDEEALKKKHGFCHWGIAVWYKPGFQIRCSCMKCTCKPKGVWDCKYNFAYCPYYYCGNQIYNPVKQLCCCGKVYTKRSHYGCCGYFYYNKRTSKCCEYDTVKPKKVNCPRKKI